MQSLLEENIPGKAFIIGGDVVKSQIGLSLRIRDIRPMDEEFLKTFSRMLEADFQWSQEKGNSHTGYMPGK